MIKKYDRVQELNIINNLYAINQLLKSGSISEERADREKEEYFLEKRFNNNNEFIKTELFKENTKIKELDKNLYLGKIELTDEDLEILNDINEMYDNIKYSEVKEFYVSFIEKIGELEDELINKY